MATKVAIIGGGVIGLSSAYYLSKDGANEITLFERDSIAQGASKANACSLLSMNGHTEKELFLMSMKLFKELPGKAIRRVEFENNGLISVAVSAQEVEFLQDEAGMHPELEIEVMDSAELQKREPGLARFPGGMLIRNGGQVNSLELCNYLRDESRSRGVVVRENTPILEVVSSSQGFKLRGRDGKRFEAEYVVNATGAWASSILTYPSINLPVSPLKGYSVTFAPQQRLLNSAIYLADIAIVQFGSGKVRAGGYVENAGFSTSVNDKMIGKLFSAVSSAVPALKNAELEDAWAGLRPYASDGIPIIGPIEEGGKFILATGHFREGVSLSLSTGKVVADFVNAGRPSIDVSELSPKRFELRRS